MNREEYIKGLEERYYKLIEMSDVLIRIIDKLIDSPQKIDSSSIEGMSPVANGGESVGSSPVDTNDEVKRIRRGFI